MNPIIGTLCIVFTISLVLYVLYLAIVVIPTKDTTIYQIIATKDMSNNVVYIVEFINVSGDYRFLRRPQNRFRLDCKIFAAYYGSVEMAIQAANQYVESLNEKVVFESDQPNS